MADKPEDSRYTSAFDRIQSRWEQATGRNDSTGFISGDWHAPIQSRENAVKPKEMTTQGKQHVFTTRGNELEICQASYWHKSNPVGSPRVSDAGFLPMTLTEYLKLLDAAGRLKGKKKRHSIPKDLPPILRRLGIDQQVWSESVFLMLKSVPRHRKVIPV